jgi:hypothetical protein
MSKRFGETLTGRLFLDLCMIKFGCNIKMFWVSARGWGGSHCSQFSLEVVGGNISEVVDLELLVNGVALGLDKVGGVGVLELELGLAASVRGVSNIDNLALLATVRLVLEINDSEARLISSEVRSEFFEIVSSLPEMFHLNFSSCFVQVHDHEPALTLSDLGEIRSDTFSNLNWHNFYYKFF